MVNLIMLRSQVRFLLAPPEVSPDRRPGGRTDQGPESGSIPRPSRVPDDQVVGGGRTSRWEPRSAPRAQRVLRRVRPVIVVRVGSEDEGLVVRTAVRGGFRMLFHDVLQEGLGVLHPLDLRGKGGSAEPARRQPSASS